jgi:DNA-directed RNA polymerase specialized sigma24 family protein
METQPWDKQFVKLLPELKRYAHAIVYSRSQKLQLHVNDYINEAYIVLTRTKKEIPEELFKNYALQAIKWTILNKLRTEARKKQGVVLYDDLKDTYYDEFRDDAADIVSTQKNIPDYENKMYLQQLRELSGKSKSKHAQPFFDLLLQGYNHGEAGEALNLTKLQGRWVGRRLLYFLNRRTNIEKALKPKEKPTVSGKNSPVIAFSVNRYKSRKKRPIVVKPEISVSLTVTKREMVLWKGKEYAILKNSGMSYRDIADIYNVSRELVRYNIETWKKHQRNQKTMESLSNIVKCH